MSLFTWVLERLLFTRTDQPQGLAGTLESEPETAAPCSCQDLPSSEPLPDRLGGVMSLPCGCLGLLPAPEPALPAEKPKTRSKEKLRPEPGVETAGVAPRAQQRRQTGSERPPPDILFLGRGVSKGLEDRQSDVAKLTAAGLPVLSTPEEVAAALNLTIPQLRWLAYHAEVSRHVHYVSFEVPKKGGGTRTLSAPHRKLATVQQWLLVNIVGRLPAEEPAHGFLPGRSILSNAQQHVGRAVVVNMDLEGFFPSIGFPAVRAVFLEAGYSPCVGTILALLCTECPRREELRNGKASYVATGPRSLPQGACTSPGLSNQVARHLDRRLTGLAATLDACYTRYADDLTFSGDASLEGRVGYLMARVRHIAREEGFAVNEKKSRVLRRNTAQRVTGLVVNERPNITRKEVRRLRAILHRARTEGLERQNREGHPHFRAWLEGKIAYVSMVRPDVGARLRADLQAVLHSP